MSEESNNWRDYLTEDEVGSLEVYDRVIADAVKGLKTVRQNRRNLYLRAMQRNHRRMQKVVDTGMEKA